MAAIRRELQSVVGFIYQPYVQAAQFCLDNNAELEQGLAWAETAISGQYVATKNFQTLRLKAQLLEALNRNSESESVMKEAIPMGTMGEVHQYARSLQVKGKFQQAFDAYKFNHSKNPTEYVTLVGLGRGYSCLGNFKEALKYLKLALPKAPNEQSKQLVEGMIKMLAEGKDANS
jgi:tetratricopeptide (TPR) repeat protein